MGKIKFTEVLYTLSNWCILSLKLKTLHEPRVIEKPFFKAFNIHWWCNLVILKRITQKYIFTLIVNKRLSGNHIYEKLNFYFFEMLIQNTHFKFKAYIAQTIEKFSYKKQGHYPSVGGLRHSSQSCCQQSVMNLKNNECIWLKRNYTVWEFMPIQKNKKTWPWKYLHTSLSDLIGVPLCI